MHKIQPRSSFKAVLELFKTPRCHERIVER